MSEILELWQILWPKLVEREVLWEYGNREETVVS